MQIEMNMKAMFKADDLNKLITSYLEKEGYKVDSIDVKIRKRTVGHQMNEYEETYLEGIEAKIRKK